MKLAACAHYVGRPSTDRTSIDPFALDRRKPASTPRDWQANQPARDFLNDLPGRTSSFVSRGGGDDRFRR
jgi:hypothetical protein